MTLEEITNQFAKTVANVPAIGKTVKFVFDEGVVHIDLTEDEAQLTNEDKPADCTITTKIETLEKLRKGEIKPMSAMMTGKLKVKGDMGLAMKLPSLISG